MGFREAMKNFFLPVAAAGMVAGAAPEAKAAPKPETTEQLADATIRTAREIPGRALEAGKKLGMVDTETPAVAKKRTAARKTAQKVKDSSAIEEAQRKIAQM